MILMLIPNLMEGFDIDEVQAEYIAGNQTSQFEQGIYPKQNRRD